MGGIILEISEYIDFESGKGACIERVCFRVQIQRDLQEAAIIRSAYLSAEADRFSTNKGFICDSAARNTSHHGISYQTPVDR